MSQSSMQPTTDQRPPAIYEAIAGMLDDVEPIKKEMRNQQQGYNFRSIDQVYDAVHPILAKHRVFPTCTILEETRTERTNKNGTTLFYVTLKNRYTFWAKDGSSVPTESIGEGMDSGDKASNKAMTAAYKYAIFQLLCIPLNAVDSEQDDHEVMAPSPKQQRANGRTANPEELGKDAEGYKVGSSPQYVKFKARLLEKFDFSPGQTFEGIAPFTRWAMSQDIVLAAGFTAWADVMTKADAVLLEQLYGRAETYARSRKKETAIA